MDFNEQITIIKESMWSQSMRKETKVKFISPQKWRSIMIKCLQALKKKGIYDNNMLDDLQVIVQRVQEQKFIEATLNIQPFKPKFSMWGRKEEKDRSFRTNIDNIEEEETSSPVYTKLMTDSKLQFKNSIIKLKSSVHERLNNSDAQLKLEKHKKSLLEQMLNMVTEEETLAKQFENKYHPYRKIIEQFLFLLENKYKLIIESEKIIIVEDLQQRLLIDIRLIQDFIVKSSEPYLAIFKSDNAEEKDIFHVKLRAFIKQYIERHEKINLSIRKIIRMASRKTALIKKLTLSLPDFADIKDFDIPQTYKIQGCYVHSMSSLMQFAEAVTSISSLKKLSEFRRSLGKDVDHYYSGQKNKPNHLEISAQTQIQILKFVITKLKSFLCEIYAQLKYLEIVYGQHDMSFRYDDSSYMYAQISVAFQALELDYP